MIGHLFVQLCIFLLLLVSSSFAWHHCSTKNMFALRRPIVSPSLRTLSMSTSSKMMNVKRYEIVPCTLYRVQAKLPVRLRNYDEQMALGRTSFDLKVIDGLVRPAVGPEFTGPNGMSLRPAGDVVRNTVAKLKNAVTVYSFLPGTPLPDNLLLLHEHSDHYSLQVREPMTFDEYNHALTEFLKTLPSQTKEQFLAAMDDEDYDN